VAWVLAAVLAAAPAAAQDKTGTTIGQFLLIEPSARIAAMGNAGVTLLDGLEAVYYNPAAVASLRRAAVQFSHSAWIADISHDWAAAALPLGDWGNAYASVTALHSGDMEVRTVSQPLGTGERFNVSDVAIGLGYGRQITERFAAGVQLSWVQETIWHTSMNTAVMSVGTIYRISKNGLHLGSSLSNFGTQGAFDGRDLRITYDQDPTRYGDNGALPGEIFTGSFGVPVLFRVGLGYPLALGPQARLRLAVDAFHPADNAESVSAGAELSWRDLVAARLGYQNAFLRDSEVGWTAGGGFRGRIQEWDYQLDYAWGAHGRLGGTHRASVGLQF
jgi:hypothetical protein